MSSVTVQKSENSICGKYDKFFSNAVTNTGKCFHLDSFNYQKHLNYLFFSSFFFVFFSFLGIGFAIGTTLSLVLFRRRLWPIHYGIGIGFGYSLKDLEIDLNSKN